VRACRLTLSHKHPPRTERDADCTAAMVPAPEEDAPDAWAKQAAAALFGGERSITSIKNKLNKKR
jgi:hypothetical protein